MKKTLLVTLFVTSSILLGCEKLHVPLADKLGLQHEEMENKNKPAESVDNNLNQKKDSLDKDQEIQNIQYDDEKIRQGEARELNKDDIARVTGIDVDEILKDVDLDQLDKNNKEKELAKQDAAAREMINKRAKSQLENMLSQSNYKLLKIGSITSIAPIYIQESSQYVQLNYLLEIVFKDQGDGLHICKARIMYTVLAPSIFILLEPSCSSVYKQN